MAYNNRNFRTVNQSPAGDQHTFRYTRDDFYYPDGAGVKKRMVQSKVIAWLIADVLGFSTAFVGWINNLDNVKSAILFVIGSIYMGARTYFYIRKGIMNMRKDRWEQEEREGKKTA